MAKSNWGITSGFIGKLGNVVGFNWKGINLQRALIKSADPRTKKQLLQRAKFALTGKLASVLYEALYEGYRHEARELRSTQSGLFLKYNLANLSGTAEALTINFEALQLSKGILRGVSFGEPALNGTTVSIDITNTANTGRRVSLADRVYVCAFCPEEEESVCIAVGTRADSTVSLSIPSTWGTKRFYLYGFVIGASSYNEAMASKTSYIGAFGTASSNGSASTPGTDGNSGGSSTGSDTGNTGNTGNTGGSQSGGSSQGGSSTSSTPVLTISKTGNGSASVTAGGNMVNSGASIAEDTQVSITITPATGMTPSATINGNNVSLTEDSGTYSGSFAMPGTNATLMINTGSSGDGDTN